MKKLNKPLPSRSNASPFRDAARPLLCSVQNDGLRCSGPYMADILRNAFSWPRFTIPSLITSFGGVNLVQLFTNEGLVMDGLREREISPVI
jgi:hypothetical protein